MQFNTLIEQIANEFITHWNNRDMKKLATYLSNDIEVCSPNIIRLFPEIKDSKICKKENVMKYWTKLNEQNYFVMKLLVLTKTDKVITCEVETSLDKVKLIATFTMDEYGKFVKMVIQYI